MKTATVKHTPTPWTLERINGRKRVELSTEQTYDAVLFGCSASHLTDEENRVNAEFIVRAVNSHEALLSALKKVEKYAFKASGDELLMWVQEAIALAEAKVQS